MKNKHCADCYYGNKCNSEEVCDYFHPVGEDAENAAVEELIEQNHHKYRDLWFEYIKED